MKLKTMLLSVAAMALAFAGNAQTHQLERTSPEAEGVSSKAVMAMMDSLTSLPGVDIHSIVVARNGKVIGEAYPAPFSDEYKHTLYSCSKTFVSTAIGIAIGENRLRLTDRVAPLFAGELPDTISENLAGITVRDLLTMTAGIVPDWEMRNHRKDWIHGYLSKPVSEPGKQFQYDSLCTYMLSAIVEKVTGMNTLDYLKLHVFTPMGITDVEWEESPEGYNTGGWGLHIQPESMTAFGQLILNKGNWHGKQLIPSDWVEAMTSRQQEAGKEDYCYQMWQCDYPGAVRADGAYGQYIIMIPDRNMVVTITQCSSMDGLKERGIIWRTLMPGVGSEPLAAGKDYKKLLEKQKSYSLALPQGKASSKQAAAVDGKTIELAENELGWKSLTLHFSKGAVVASVECADGDRCSMELGYKKWKISEIEAYPPYSIMAQERFKGLEKRFHTGGAYAWASSSKLVMDLQYVDWISSLLITVDFGSENPVFKVVRNYAGGELEIKGTLK